MVMVGEKSIVQLQKLQSLLILFVDLVTTARLKWSLKSLVLPEKQLVNQPHLSRICGNASRKLSAHSWKVDHVLYCTSTMLHSAIVPKPRLLLF